MASPVLLIVDYNLSRISEVRHLRDHARRRHGAAMVLIRPNPTADDYSMADEVIDLHPLQPNFVEAALAWIERLGLEPTAGIVFSDNAVHSGSELLARLGLPVDSPGLAIGAFSKYEYRRSEARIADILTAQRIMVPDFAEIASLPELHDFARNHPRGFVIKPATEGNNRGVVVVSPGDDLTAAFAEVLPYLEGGVICEEFIPYRREYSFDGLGPLGFVTEKVGAGGRYPVEIAQVLPAHLSDHERITVERAGRQANWLVGQCDGPFHNEVKISDDGHAAAVVEPNRRPGGMGIWALARAVYGIDLHHRWMDTVFGTAAPSRPLIPGGSAATVMLGVGRDCTFSADDISCGADLFGDAVHATAVRFGLADGELAATDFTWLSGERRVLRAIARDNGDFAAQGGVVLRRCDTDLRTIVHAIRAQWADALDRALVRHVSVRKA